MPKYTQTLTGTTYNATDFSTSLKTAFDSLGWGTGKVDISGGYRYTATDQTNTDTTPLSVTTFQENYIGKNIINPTGNASYGGGLYYVGMYLPGVLSYRLKYTVLSDTLANGSSVTLQNANRQTMCFMYNSMRPDYQTELNTATFFREIKPFPATLSVGTQYTTDWSTGDIATHCGIAIKHTTENIYLRLDAIEYKVSQNKFAFQSPNLDSPTFESNTINYNGTLISSLVTYPIKDSKTPIVRLIKTAGAMPYNLFDSNQIDYYDPNAMMQCWNEAIYTYSDDLTKVGNPTTVIAKDRIAEGNFGNDIIIRAGSNTTFQGFFINTQQGSVYNGAVWDTIDKTRSYPNATPVYPSQRKSFISLTHTSKNPDYNVQYYSSYIVSPTIHYNYYTFRVKNQATISGFYVTDSWSYSYMNIIDHTIDFTVHSASKQADGSIKISGTVHPQTNKVLTVRNINSNRNYVKFNSDLTLAPGYYVIAIRSDRLRNYFKGGNAQLEETMLAYKVRDIEAVAHSNTCKKYTPSPFQGMRYIRTSMSGSTANSGNHWVELQVLNGSGTNYALNKTVTVTSTNSSATNLQRITDGSTTDANLFADITTGTEGYAQFMIDLGTIYTDVSQVKIWRYYADGRTYNNQVVEISSDGSAWFRIDDGTNQAETSSGRSYPVPAYNTPVSIPLDYGFNSNVDYTDYTVGVVYGTGKAITPLTHINIQLEQSSSGTPSQQVTAFAENWVSVAGRSEYFHSSTYRREAVSRYNGSRFTYEGRAPFSIDLQSQNALYQSGSTLTGGLAPGEGSEDSYRSMNNGNPTGTRNFEFMSNTNKFDNGVRYHRLWLSNRYGMSLRTRNIFHYASTVPGIGTSYTTPDGSEYVIVTYTYDNNVSGLLFRLNT